ncbi:hypothetical protein RclHR1_12800002 [Rhizophagus clarus]|uniref:Zinc finger C3HC4 RING-type domain-containing protein n=1 Tax=Rhizophagus clarus TaxID=94130 RepID=A0A2Z6Q859_9GLOM|nr:hypothetical protein RclHR1_12800002 [Rhizophagus clarus]
MRGRYYTLEGGIIKEFTLASCGHIFHQKCLEEYLVDGESSCPYDGCNRDIETYLSPELLNGEKTALMDIDDNGAEGSEILIGSGDVAPEEQRVAYISSTDQKKRTRESSTEKSSNKKAKKTGGKKVSSMLKQLIEELLTDVPAPTAGENLEEANDNVVGIFLQLSNRIDNAETKNEDASRGLIHSYFDFGEALFNRYKELKPTYGKEGSRALVKSEVRKEIPETKFSDDALKKRMERARKMFRIFNTIGKEKIARVKSIPPGFILNLTVDDTDYVIAEVLKGAGTA